MLARFTLALTLVGCYSPDLADCTVTCAADTDCGGGQTCNGGQCAREGLSCATGAGTDADIAMPPDAMADSAPLRPDAASQLDPDAPVAEPDAPPPPPTTTLRVKVKDHGRVTPGGLVPCTDEQDECIYTVEVGEPITLTAMPQGNRVFEKWEEACEGQPTPICVITVGSTQTKVTAKFRKP